MSTHLTRDEVLSVSTLLEQCGELWADAPAWQLHLARSIERLVGGFTGLVMISDRSSGAPRVLEFATEGDTRVPFRDFLEAGAELAVPGAAKAFDELTTRGSFSGRFVELSTDYHRSAFFERFMRPQCAHDTLCALSASGADTHLNLSLSRSVRDRPFTKRDAELLGTIAQAFGPRIHQRLSIRRQLGRHGLPHREQQTLDALLCGDSEKQIAGRLEISGATVHQYVTSIYRHFGVNSRGELTAYFLRRQPSDRRGNAAGRSKDRAPGHALWNRPGSR